MELEDFKTIGKRGIYHMRFKAQLFINNIADWWARLNHMQKCMWVIIIVGVVAGIGYVFLKDTMD